MSVQLTGRLDWPWDDDDVLAHAEQVALARTQSRALAGRVAALPPAQVRSFVRRLWEHAGTLDAGGRAPSLLVEPPLAGDVEQLLARLGIRTAQDDVDGQVRLTVPAVEDRVCFLREVAMARSSETSFGGVQPQRRAPTGCPSGTRAGVRGPAVSPSAGSNGDTGIGRAER